MSAKRHFSAILLFLMLVGCSETTKEAAPLPEIVSTAYFPFINGNSIYNFEPVSGESELLASSETGLIIALDTDASRSITVKDENNVDQDVYSHSATPEYIAYANKQTLHVYDLNTRYDHQVFSFKEDKQFDPVSQTFIDGPASYICDIQKSVILDEETRLVRSILYKDELKIYVKTSHLENCIDSEENYQYWQINIEESDQTFTIRRRILKEHTHLHNHKHDHDNPLYKYDSDHNHDHSDELLEAIEIANEKDPTFGHQHEHEHTHTHDFVYGDDHYHDFLSRKEVDAVHNAPLDKKIKTHQEVQFEAHPILKGNKTSIDSIDEALMYSGKPVVDLAKRTFGYLGLNSLTNTYKFYSINLDTFEKKLLWEMTNSNFTNTNTNNAELSDIEKITPKFNRISNFEYIEENLLINSNNKLFYFTLSELFDDDESETRETSIANPLFSSSIDSPSLESRIKYNSQSLKLAIIEGMDVWAIDFFSQQPYTAELIKRYNEPNLLKITAAFVDDELLINKHFQEGDDTLQSLTSLQANGLENKTLMTKTNDSISIQELDSDIMLTITDANTQSRSITHYGVNFSSNYIESLEDSLWSSSTVDYRNFTESNIITLLISEYFPSTPNAIDTPKLYQFDKNASSALTENEEFGYIQQEITGARKVVIFNDLYGLVEVDNIDDGSTTYFFSTSKSSFNFDNEFKTMKPLTTPEP